MSSEATTTPPAAASFDPQFTVTVRVVVRRISDERIVGKPAVASFDTDRLIPAGKLGEVALEACTLAASGVGGPVAAVARARVAARDLARRPEVRRTVAVFVAALRRGADAVEHGAAAAASRLVVAAPADSEPEDEF